MAISPEFLEMMPDTITVFAQSSVDKYGKRTHSATGTAIQCRLIFDTRESRDAEGREVVEEGRAICYGAFPAVTTAHRLALPNGKTPIVLSVATIKDETGQNHHTVITFGR